MGQTLQCMRTSIVTHNYPSHWQRRPKTTSNRSNVTQIRRVAASGDIHALRPRLRMEQVTNGGIE